MTVPIEGAPPIDSGTDQIHAVIATVVTAVGVFDHNYLLLASGIALCIFLLIARSDYSYYAITDIGRYERIQNRGISATDTVCEVCEGVADGGQEARRFTELVVGGIVLARYDERSRYYCDEHGSVAVTNDLTELQSQGMTEND